MLTTSNSLEGQLARRDWKMCTRKSGNGNVLTLVPMVLITSTSSTIWDRSSLTESSLGTSSLTSLLMAGKLFDNLEARSDVTSLAVLSRSILSRESGAFGVKGIRMNGKLRTVWARKSRRTLYIQNLNCCLRLSVKKWSTVIWSFKLNMIMTDRQ